MNARITCGLIATDAGRVAALLAAILTVGTSVSAKAADISEYIVTDEAESIIADDQGRSPAKSPAPADRPVLADVPDDAEEEDFVEPSVRPSGEPSGEYGSTVYEAGGHVSCASCAGKGCSECRDTKGWFNRILCDVEPRLVGQVDALFLWQGAIPSRSLYVSDIEPFDTVLDADQGQTPVSVGTRYNLQMNLDCTYAFEGNYFSVYGFEGEQSTPYSDGLYAMDNLAGLDYGDIEWARFRTSGSIQSAEFNWRRKTCSPVTWLAGFRWVEWNQGLRIVDIYQGFDGPANDIVNTQTGNDLYGGQIGADLMLWNRWQDVKVNGIGKAGVFYNQAYSRTNVPTELQPIDGDAEADQTALFAEVGANATVKLTHWLSWRFGYSVFWLSGVATPVDQLDRVGQAPPLEQPRINTNGSVLLHGATTGLEARW